MVYSDVDEDPTGQIHGNGEEPIGCLAFVILTGLEMANANEYPIVGRNGVIVIAANTLCSDIVHNDITGFTPCYQL